MIIEDIYKKPYKYGGFQYAGTLRNGRSFELHEIVYIGFHIGVFKAEVIGKELPLGDNQEYIYKLKLPSGVISEEITELSCQRIFKSMEDAKESMIHELEVMTKIWKEEIERYFKEHM